MSLRKGLAPRVPPETGVVSLRGVADGLHLTFPTSLRDMVGRLEPIQLSFSLNSGTCSGACQIGMTNDGLVHYTGRVHDSGAFAATYTVITSIPLSVALSGPVIIPHRGHVGGTFAFDSRDDSWNKTVTDAIIADNWVAVKAAVTLARTDFGTNTGAIELLDGIVNGATGTFVFGL